MTDTTTNDNTAPQPPSGTLEHLDPHGLAIGDNVRDNTAPSPEFLDSIQQHGVLVPITAVRGHDGTVTVRNGQRRTLAAREAGLTSIPAYVLPANAADEGTAAVDRIVHKIVTNDHKADSATPSAPRHPADVRHRCLGHESRCRFRVTPSERLRQRRL
jgi:ParB family transcriptional regulator, chromosome partitioning protein